MALLWPWPTVTSMIPKIQSIKVLWCHINMYVCMYIYIYIYARMCIIQMKRTWYHESIHKETMISRKALFVSEVSLQYTAMHCNALQRTAIHCNTLQYTANTLQHRWYQFLSEVVLQHTAKHCKHTATHTATHCNTDDIKERCVLVWGRSATHCNTAKQCNTLQHTAKTVIDSNTLLHRWYQGRPCWCLGSLYTTLRHTATHSNTLQSHYNLTATHCNTGNIKGDFVLVSGRSAPHCSTLQHTATHCNTLQHITIQCNTDDIKREIVLLWGDRETRFSLSNLVCYNKPGRRSCCHGCGSLDIYCMPLGGW